MKTTRLLSIRRWTMFVMLGVAMLLGRPCVALGQTTSITQTEKKSLIEQANKLADEAKKRGDAAQYSEQQQLLLRALPLYEKATGKRSAECATVHCDLGECLSNLGDIQKSIEEITLSLKIREEVLGKENADYATSLSKLAYMNCYMGKMDEAIDLELEAMDIRGKVVGVLHKDYGISLWHIAYYLDAIGQYDLAINYGEMSEQVMATASGKNSYDYASALNVLCIVYIKQEQYKKALSLGLEILRIMSETIGTEHPDYGSALHNVSCCYNELAQYDNALQYLKESLRLREKFYGREHYGYADACNALSVCYSNMGDLRKSLDYALEAMNIRKKVFGENSTYYATSLNNVAIAYCSMGNMEDAIKCLEKSYTIKSSLLGNDNPELVGILINLSDLYRKIGLYTKALNCCNIAIELQKNSVGTESAIYAMILDNMAQICIYEGNYSKAVELLKEAVVVTERVLGKEHPNYALRKGNLSLALSYIERYREAIALAEEALLMFEHFPGKEYQCSSILQNLTSFSDSANDKSNTTKYANRYINGLKKIICRDFSGMSQAERGLYWGQYSYWFQNVLPEIGLRYSSNEMDALAYDGVLFSKGLLLNAETEMRKQIAESGDKEAIALYDDLQMDRALLKKLYEKPKNERAYSTDSLEQEINRLDLQLVAKAKAYGDYTRNLRIGWKDVLNKLAKDEVAIEFVAVPCDNDSTKYCAYVLKGTDKQPHLRSCITLSHNQLSGESVYTDTSISKMLWGSLANELKNVRNVYFSPTDELYQVAIESLPDWEDPTRRVSDRWNLYRLSSTRELALAKDKHSIKEAVVYGGLHYDAASGMSYLPATEKEAAEVDATLRTVKVNDMLLTGDKGTETSFKSLSGQNKNLLHIATHGFYWTERESRRQRDAHFLLETDSKHRKYEEDKALTRSGLYLAMEKDKEKNDGVLTAQEISQLDLRNIDLVVLSACQTGLGEVTGDGVFGLQRGFKKAGAQSILMSLWKVDDEATRWLMNRFYHYLTTGESKCQSLKDAQRDLREYKDRDYSNPKYWAGFVVLDGLN